MNGTSEYARKTVHIAMGSAALLLRYLSWWQSAAVAAAALLFNLLVLPRIGGTRLYRTSEVARGFPAGIVLYPASVLVLILMFPSRPDIAGAAWAVMAFGDGLATIVGQSVGGRRLPWNREKTLAGSLAFFGFGSAAGILLALWCRPAVDPLPPLAFSIGAPVLAAFVAAAAESIPIRLDDNVSVPASAASVLWACSLITPDVALASLPGLLRAAPAAIALNLVVAWAGYRAGTVSRSGMLAGAAIGTIIFMGTGWRGWLLLLATFLTAAVTSRLGLRRKTLLGIAEERGGRRGAGNAIANTGVACGAAILAALSASGDLALVAFAAALAAGGSDTMASEIGKAWGRHAYLVTSFRGVPPGTSGAVSIEGTAAGFVGALALSALAAGLALVPAAALVPIVAGATVGAFAESVLGATLEGPGILNNDVLNFLNTAIAAVTAILLSGAGI
jgi:uncharacterized protein (TIGR00297 family)